MLSGPDDPRRVGWESAAIDAAAGVRRIVRLSAIGAAPGSPVPFWVWHGQVDERLRASRVPSVILRSSLYMSSAAPVGARVAIVDPADVGAAAAAALAGGRDGRTYTLTARRRSTSRRPSSSSRRRPASPRTRTPAHTSSTRYTTPTRTCASPSTTS